MQYAIGLFFRVVWRSKEHDMSILRTSTPFAAATAIGSILGFVHPVDGGGCNGGGPTIEIHVNTPCCSSPSGAKHDDILLQYVVWEDGTMSDQFIYAAGVRDVEYDGPNGKFRVITGPNCSVGDPGVHDIEDEDGNGGSISELDKTMFADRILNAWNHENLNAYVDLRSSSHYAFTVDFEEVIRDDSPLADDVGELLVFEVSGNSIVKLEAMNEAGQVIGQPVIIEDWKRVAPDRLYVGRYTNNGTPRCGSYEYKAIGVDISEFGVTQLMSLRVSRPSNSGCADTRADTRIIGVKTAIMPTAAMVFD